VPEEVDQSVRSFKRAMEGSSSQEKLPRLAEDLATKGAEEETARGGVDGRSSSARRNFRNKHSKSSSGKLPKLASLKDDRRLAVPPLEDRVKEAEKTLVRIHNLQFAVPSASGEAKQQDDYDGDGGFAPVSVIQPQRLNSGWGWLLGEKGKRRKSIRHFLHKRVIEVN